MSRIEGRKRMGEDAGKGKLLNDIETLSKALNIDKPQPKGSFKSSGRIPVSHSKSKLKDSSNEEASSKDKKSMWSWKGFKALTGAQNKRFNCSFSVQVHLVEGLPVECDGLSLGVHWKRRDSELTTRAARVMEGIAEFEEQLTHMCSVYGSRNGSRSSAKYEARHFLLYVSVMGRPELDLGKHRLDLTRLLPLTLEELEEENSSGKWTTSFRLSGIAKGATLNVSFGYLVVGNNAVRPAMHSDLPRGLSLRENRDDESTLRRGKTLPSRSHVASRSVREIKDLHEVLPTVRSTLSDSVNILYQKFDEEKLSLSVDKPELEYMKPKPYTDEADEDNVKTQCEVTAQSETSMVERGTELLTEEKVNPGLEILKSSIGSLQENLDIPKVGSSDVVASLFTEEKVNPGLETLKSTVGSLQENLDFSKVGSSDVVASEDTKIQESHGHIDDFVETDLNDKENDLCDTDSLMKELESALSSVSTLLKEGSDSQEDECQILSEEKHLEVESNDKVSGEEKSISVDDVTESVACEFLDMLGIEHSPFGLSSESEPESPRERLLRQFEKDSLANGCSLFNFDDELDLTEFGGDILSGSGLGSISEDFHHSSTTEFYKNANVETPALGSKTRASVLEDMETEALMREWGLNEKAFQCPPPDSSGGFGSPIDLPLEQPIPLPPLGEGLGPFVQTKDGGFLRSMSPELFRNAKVGGSLVMQVSSPVVVPAEMGSGITEILQGLASVGIEKLSMQATKLMPLEDISGKTMQHIMWEANPSLEGPERQVSLQQDPEVDQNMYSGEKIEKTNQSRHRSSKRLSNSIDNHVDSECVSLEDLAPLAMDKIEALSVEGLRIQSGLSNDDAPSSVTSQFTGQSSALEGKMVNIGGSLGLEGAGGLQLMDIKDSSDDDGGLMGLSLTLDEWMRLDSGVIDDEDQISERTSKILAAHHATPGDWFHGKSNGERKRGKGSRKCGLLGNNFTVALMVQLRDPLRNYEPVGTPMLALIQVERLFVPPKPKIYCTVSEIRPYIDDEDESESATRENKEVLKEKMQEEDVIPMFKIKDVHVAGLTSEPGKKVWGSKTQQQSGSRWLLANGMGKSNKFPVTRSKAPAKTSASETTKIQPGESFWSISSRVGAKLKDLASLNSHIRNPNVVIPNETLKLR
ncbi:protein PLASTID MOVEMENT IMPAIRED 1-RELATED 1 [Heracleum sosnowskyi]|uniref:Protein PLASTID MOVEMENT IMPAIRED 1-RELATED 1 n=1 Tax=Heracleum sosnowskyi TaxID=360622 RepID=A0AAD8MA59_9APIA|nr:protein PLASTID MOVEMENT IMPAIRED 1-RELATED 1 [Heracleum sosnowskyi]